MAVVTRVQPEGWAEGLGEEPHTLPLGAAAAGCFSYSWASYKHECSEARSVHAPVEERTGTKVTGGREAWIPDPGLSSEQRRMPPTGVPTGLSWEHCFAFGGFNTRSAFGFGCELCISLWKPHVCRVFCQSPGYLPFACHVLFTTSLERGRTEVTLSDVNSPVALGEGRQSRGLNLIHDSFTPKSALV